MKILRDKGIMDSVLELANERFEAYKGIIKFHECYKLSIWYHMEIGQIDKENCSYYLKWYEL